MSSVSGGDISALKQFRERGSAFKERLLAGYIWLRGSPSIGLIVFGFLLLVVAFWIDPTDWTVQVGPTHGTFAGLFGIWGFFWIIFGIFSRVSYEIYYRYEQLVEDEY